jgi:hypothetical protein
VTLKNYGGPARNIMMAIVVLNSSKEFRTQEQYKINSMAGKSSDVFVYAISTPCENFYERNVLLGNISAAVVGYEAA